MPSETSELDQIDDPSFRQRCRTLTVPSRLQTVFTYSAGLCILAAIGILLDAYGLRWPWRRYRLFPFRVSAWGAIWPGVAAAVFLAGRFFASSNCYLIDPVGRCLYQSASLLGWSRRRVVFREGDILGITAGGKKIDYIRADDPDNSRDEPWWEYRVIAVGKDGRLQPLSVWRRDALPQCNAEAAELAGLLGCPHYAAPNESTPCVNTERGTPSLEFTEPRSERSARPFFIGLGVLLLIAWVWATIRH